MAKPQYVEQDKYSALYYEAQKQARLFFLPFNEYERLAANKIRQDLPGNIPKVNDGSLAALLMETPMRVLAQLPTGDVKIIESLDPKTGEATYPQPWLQELANFVLTKKIIPHANTQAPFFSKWQTALYRALQYGSCPIYSFYTSRGDYQGADMVLPYIRDVYLEAGKSSDLDSDYIFMDTYYTKLQLRNIIAKANNVKESGVDGPWNVKTLQKILDSGELSEKDYRSKNPAERNKPVRQTQVKFTTIFQRGVQAPFDTFHLGSGSQIEGNVDIVRSAKNPDPTGDMPIHFLYAFEDLINPYGKGQIEISGGTQNVLDYMVQLHVLGTQIGLQPPIEIRGDRTSTDLDSLVYSPSQFWFSGNAVIDVKETSSSIYKEFPQTYGLYKTQLLNAQGTSSVDVSGESGDPVQGKTPAAINKNTAQEGSHDNFLRNQAHEAFRKVIKSMLNIHFANMQGTDIEKLEEDDAVKLMRAGLIPTQPDPNDPQGPGVPQVQEIEMEWDNLRAKFDFDVDPDSSIVKDDAEQVSKLSEILDLIQQNPYLLMYIQQSGSQLNLGEVYAQLFTKLGLQDMEKILTPIPPGQSKTDPPPMAFDKPRIDMKYPDLPPAGQIQAAAHAGITLSMKDVLQGPVLDPNIRGVFNPQDEPPQETNLPEANGQSPNQPPRAAPVPPGDQPPTAAGQGAQQRPSPQSGPSAQSQALLQQTMQQYGVDQQKAMAIMHAKALGIPEDQIAAYLQKQGASVGR